MYASSPRPNQPAAAAWAEQYAREREALRRELAEQLRRNMASVVGHLPTADLLLVAADGRKLPAHQCILKRRAPFFYQRYVQTMLEAVTPRNVHARQLIEIAVGDVDSGALEFFIRSIYTDEEVPDMSWMAGGGRSSTNDDGLGPPNGRGAGGRGFGGDVDGTNDQMGGGTDDEENFNIMMPDHNTNMMREHHNDNQRQQLHGEELLSTTKPSRPPTLVPKFIGLQNCANKPSEHAAQGELRKEERKPPASIFPFFIGFGGSEDVEDKDSSRNPTLMAAMTRSLPTAATERSESPLSTAGSELTGSIRSRALAARRLSACSINSLTSIDLLTPSQEVPMLAFFGEQANQAASRLGQDLLAILTEEQDLADVRLVVADRREELRAHSCVLWACGSEFFRYQLSCQMQSNGLFRIELGRFSGASVQFLLQILYGGLTCLPSAESNPFYSLDPWELLELGAYTKVEMLQRVVVLHLRATFCHFFHRPCATCVSAVFDSLPKMEMEIPELKRLFEEAMQWQASNFTRIWKGRVFLHLDPRWQKQCRDALLQRIDEETVIEVLLGCEKLHMMLPRIKLFMQGLAQNVLKMVQDVEEYCLEFLVNSLDCLIQSKTFRSNGKGLALNLTLLEDILPSLVHSLSAETTIRTFVSLKELLAQMDVVRSSRLDREQMSGASSCTNSPMKKAALPPIAAPLSSRSSSLHGSSSSLQAGSWREQLIMDEWNPRFKCLCHRLLELMDRHMLHFANSIVNSTEWKLLNAEEQSRIREFGLFVESRMPRVAPPRFSSAGRSYKRSSSVGYGHNSTKQQLHHHSQQQQQFANCERARSLERNYGSGSDSSSHRRLIPSSSTSIGGTTRPSLSTQVEEEMSETGSARGGTEVGVEEQEPEEILERKADEKCKGKDVIEESKDEVEDDKSMIAHKSRIPAKVSAKSSGQKRKNANADELMKRQREGSSKSEEKSRAKSDGNKERVKTGMEAKMESKAEAKMEAEVMMESSMIEIDGKTITSDAKMEMNLLTRMDGNEAIGSAIEEKPKKHTISTGSTLAMAVSPGKQLQQKKKTEEMPKVEQIGNQNDGHNTEGGIATKADATGCQMEASTSKMKEATHQQQCHVELGEKKQQQRRPRVDRRTTQQQTMSERQRTQTLMTVDQNLRAGINAFIDHMGPPAAAGVQPPISTEASTTSMIHDLKKIGATKPQSIVRPMPKVSAAQPPTAPSEPTRRVDAGTTPHPPTPKSHQNVINQQQSKGPNSGKSASAEKHQKSTQQPLQQQQHRLPQEKKGKSIRK